MPRRFNRRSRFRRPRRRRRFNRRRRFRRRRMVALDPERKTVEVVGTNISLFSTGSTFPINLVSQGVDFDERIGRQMLCVSNLISYTLTINLTSVFPVEVRTALIHFKQPNGTELTLADVWDDIGGGASAVMAHRNLDNVGRFKILWTRIHRLSLDKQTLVMSKFRPLRVIARYDNPIGIVANLQSGGLWFVAISTTNLTANAPTITVNSRTRFVG